MFLLVFLFLGFPRRFSLFCFLKGVVVAALDFFLLVDWIIFQISHLKQHAPMDTGLFLVSVTRLNVLQPGCKLSTGLLRMLPFRVVNAYFTNLRPKIPDILSIKFYVNKLGANTDHWGAQLLTAIGTVKAIKMVSLLRFLHAFQNLPLCLNMSIFLHRLHWQKTPCRYNLRPIYFIFFTFFYQSQSN